MKSELKHINDAYECKIVRTEDGYIITPKVSAEEDERAYDMIESGSYVPKFALVYKREKDSEWEIGGYHLPELNIDNVTPLFSEDSGDKIDQIRGIGTAMYIDAYDKGFYRDGIKRVRYPDAVGFWERMGCYISRPPYDDNSFVDMDCDPPTKELCKLVKNCLE